MLIFPAIDLIDGKCVRLTQGDYQQKTIFSDSPVAVAQGFAKTGCKFLHIVDLDGAKAGSSQNLAVIEKIVANVNLSVQVGGGIRTVAAAEKLINIGVDRIILGTIAVTNQQLVADLIKRFGPQRIVVSIDSKDNTVKTEGWLSDSDKTERQLLDELIALGIQQIIYTDISSDGMLAGPNFANIAKLAKANLQIIVAGGVSYLQHLTKLKTMGIYGAIIGKALYKNTIDLKDAVKQCQLNYLNKRIIPCMDVKDGRVVKGISFKNLKDAGDPIELAKKYCADKADELVILDITATIERRKNRESLVKNIARNINIPFTVGGGISSIDDIKLLLHSGADKVSIGSAAVRDIDLIKNASRQFGSQCIVISVDAKKSKDGWQIYIDGGRTATDIDAIEFCKHIYNAGAGELLVNSLDNDGKGTGYDLELLAAIGNVVPLPIIASSGVGTLEHFSELFEKTNATAALAASIFHYGKYTIGDIKQYLGNC